MSTQDLKATIEAMKNLQDSLTSSPEKALAFLVESGVVLSSGELTEQYRQSA